MRSLRRRWVSQANPHSLLQLVGSRCRLCGFAARVEPAGSQIGPRHLHPGLRLPCSGVVISVRTPSYFEPKKMMEGLSALNNVLNLHMLTKHAMPARQLSTKKNLSCMMH